MPQADVFAHLLAGSLPARADQGAYIPLAAGESTEAFTARWTPRAIPLLESKDVRDEQRPEAGAADRDGRSALWSRRASQLDGLPVLHRHARAVAESSGGSARPGQSRSLDHRLADPAAVVVTRLPG